MRKGHTKNQDNWRLYSFTTDVNYLSQGNRSAAKYACELKTILCEIDHYHIMSEWISVNTRTDLGIEFIVLGIEFIVFLIKKNRVHCI